jgi:glycosyltransferase involved in cell wall biosynthesis
VLHFVSVDTTNYYLNNLFDYSDPHEVELSAVTLAATGGFIEDFEKRGGSAVALDCIDRRKYLKAVGHLKRIIEAGKIDIVHTHLYDPTVLGLATGKALGRKVVVTRHHSDAVHRLPGRLRRAAYLSGERIVNRFVDQIIAPSRKVYETLVEIEQVPCSKVALIPYGQTVERFDAVSAIDVARVRDEFGLANRVALVCVSRLHEEKGHPYLLEAVAGLRQSGLDAVLLLVGRGPELEMLRGLASRMGIEENVRFLGWRDDALALLAAADVVVHPSLQEALPSAVIEAVMLERPVVATDVSGIRDVLGDSEFGVIVPPADAAAIRSAIERTLQDLEGARDRAREGRKHVLESMGAESVARAYTECYRKVMGR